MGCCGKNWFQRAMMVLIPNSRCWVIFDSTWHDECFWDDTEIWID